MIKRLFTSISLLLLLFSFSYSFAADYTVEPQEKVIEQALKLSQKGILKQKENGYLYVEVPRDFIGTLLPLIKASGKIKAPGHYTSKKGIGAHISVIYDQERTDHGIKTIKELGQEYEFTVGELRTVRVRTMNGTKKLWILAVYSPELEKLREKYGLKSLLKGHDFHITIGAESKAVAEKDREETLDQDAA